MGGLLLAGALPAAAGDVEFNPTLALGAAYNSNIDVLAATERSAGSLRLSADLPLRYRTGRDTLTASYRPARTNFEGDNGADDFTAHALSLTWDRTVSRRADFTMSARAVRSESQVISEDKPDAALTFVERTQIDRYEFSVGGSVQTGQRSNVSWDGGLRVQKFEDLPGTDFVDSRGASVGLGWTAQTGAVKQVVEAFQQQDINDGDTVDRGDHEIMIGLDIAESGPRFFDLHEDRGSQQQRHEENPQKHQSLKASEQL